MNSTVTLYFCTAALSFAVIAVEFLTLKRVIQLEHGYECNVGHAANGPGLQCNRLAPEDSASKKEAGS